LVITEPHQAALGIDHAESEISGFTPVLGAATALDSFLGLILTTAPCP
jgi:hypothetical protein